MLGVPKTVLRESQGTRDKFPENTWIYFCKVYNKITNIRQHNNYLLEYIGYMFRPVNRSSSGHRWYSELKVLFRYWDPNIYSI